MNTLNIVIMIISVVLYVGLALFVGLTIFGIIKYRRELRKIVTNVHDMDNTKNVPRCHTINTRNEMEKEHIMFIKEICRKNTCGNCIYEDGCFYSYLMDEVEV